MTLLIGLLVVAALFVRSIKAEDRARYLESALAFLRRMRTDAARPRPELESFNAALRDRARSVVATPVLIAINIAVFVGLVSGARPMSDGNALIHWGANYGPATTNGEWWRLVTAMFVHPGPARLLVYSMCLWQAGNVIERLVGRYAFCAVYLFGGIFAGLIGISVRPLTIAWGASASLFALYGVLIAAMLWCSRQPSPLRVPRLAMTRFAAPLGLFLLLAVSGDGLTFSGELAGLLIGFLAGAVLTWNVASGTPDRRWLAAATGIALVAAVMSAMPMRGLVDARAEMARVVATEERTAALYNESAGAFTKGRLSGDSMADLIQRSIMPELQAADGRLRALNRVPVEQQPLLDSAAEYLRLRRESWKLRADGLRRAEALMHPAAGRHPESGDSRRHRLETEYRANLAVLGHAESAERASLQALQKIRP